MSLPRLIGLLALLATTGAFASAARAGDEPANEQKPAATTTAGESAGGGEKKNCVVLPPGQVMTVKYFETLETAEEYGSETDEAEAERFRDFSDALRHAFLVSGLLVELHIVHGPEETPPEKPVLQIIVTSWGVDRQGRDECRFNVAYRRADEKVDLGEFVGRQANDDSPSGLVPADHFHAAVLAASRELVKHFRVDETLSVSRPGARRDDPHVLALKR